MYTNTISLSPAKWVWFPSKRTLANTFVLFRKEIQLKASVAEAKGWITADSRYRLTVNGERIQWGPAPSDPRHLDVDFIDLKDYLTKRNNCIGIEALFFGMGDGTWVMGKPGMIFSLNIKYLDGSTEQIVSDKSWNTAIDRAHQPGQYKRWYLRCLQEQFDARTYPFGWDTCGYAVSRDWLPAMELQCPPDKPAICGAYSDYLWDSDCENQESACLVPRKIPLIDEKNIDVQKLKSSGRIKWLRDPEDWFQFRTPGCYEILPEDSASENKKGEWAVDFTEDKAVASYLTFEFEEQVVGWPYFTIDAPEGTIVELITQESHDDSATKWLDTHKYTWSRFICKEGLNHFETFDFESLRWVQLHIRNSSRQVIVSKPGIRRRSFMWPNKPFIKCSEPNLQRLFNASVNTILNNCQDTIVDGMGRERQQYSGDIGHVLHAVRYAFGEVQLPERFIQTYGSGMTMDGYFMDCWPAYDRMVRIAQRQLGFTKWGPMLDHGVQFIFDCWNHFYETGRTEAIKGILPNLKRFASYLESLISIEGLLPVEDIGVPVVWIDHEAYRMQRHKQCAFNLYAAAMLQYALAPLLEIFRDDSSALHFRNLGKDIQTNAIRVYWNKDKRTFVINQPWLDEEDVFLYCDRSLAAAILFNQCPENDAKNSLDILAGCPPEMGLSYPANAGWRYRALAHEGRTDIIIHEFREKWAGMQSVVLNNTISEFFNPREDTSDQWSHAAVAPLYVLFMDIAGIKPLEPGFEKVEIRPQLNDIGDIELTAFTVKGPIAFSARKVNGGHDISITLPENCIGEVLLPDDSKNNQLQKLDSQTLRGLTRFRLKAGVTNRFSAIRADSAGIRGRHAYGSEEIPE